MSDNGWQRVVQQLKTNDNEWQRMTTDGIESNNEWCNERQQVATDENE